MLNAGARAGSWLRDVDGDGVEGGSLAMELWRFGCSP